jgi:hypothetical protein
VVDDEAVMPFVALVVLAKDVDIWEDEVFLEEASKCLGSVALILLPTTTW